MEIRLSEWNRFSGQFKKIKLLLFVLVLMCMSAVYAQGTVDSVTGKFKQHIEWVSDPNALEYKVEIRSSGKALQSITTEDNYVNLNLPAGSYEYRITVYDFLGRAYDVSAWQKFDILKANPPSFAKVKQDVELDVSEGDKIVFPVEVDNVSSESKVTLVNTKTDEKIAGKLVISEPTGKSETGKASAEFPKVSSGDWKLVVENPSGLKSESPVISVKAVNKKAEKEKQEKERLAKEKAEREEKERLEREQLEQERLAAEKAEQERIAAEKAEQERLEQERLAREQAEREEQERLERERLEQERLAAEKAEQEEAERLAREARKNRKTLSIEVKAGGAVALNTFDADIWSQFFAPSPYASISYVPNLDWFIKPGIEVFASGFTFENSSGTFGEDKWEYKNSFFYNNVQASLIAQLRLVSQKVYVNIKAGGGISEIILDTQYAHSREPSRKAFLYPKLNAGFSIEYIPLKHLVLELGADYNKILSSKVNDSYLMPYLQVGVRF